jgi:hypothetical protein
VARKKPTSSTKKAKVIAEQTATLAEYAAKTVVAAASDQDEGR